MTRYRTLIPMDEEYIKLVAGIMGGGSASARALAELHARREAGEDVSLFRNGRYFVVAPTTPPSSPSKDEATTKTSIP